jgi:regulator of protease activity HflC (stomatin/prohibitin superfamily)
MSSTTFGFVYKNEGDENQSQEWYGPFSVERQMIAQRDEARRKHEAEQEEPGETHPLDVIMEEYDL